MMISSVVMWESLWRSSCHLFSLILPVHFVYVFLPSPFTAFFSFLHSFPCLSPFPFFVLILARVFPFSHSSDYEVNCRPAHGFIHVLPITDNMTEFKHVIQQQRISGNMDTPEGGFDAMLQAAVCQVNTEAWVSEVQSVLPWWSKRSVSLYCTDKKSNSL